MAETDPYNQHYSYDWLKTIENLAATPNSDFFLSSGETELLHWYQERGDVWQEMDVGDSKRSTDGDQIQLSTRVSKPKNGWS